MPKEELEGCIFRRGYADEGAAWLGGGILPTSRCDVRSFFGHHAKRGSLRTPAGLHRKTRDRGRVASCGAQVLHVTLVLLPRELLLESSRGSP